LILVFHFHSQRLEECQKAHKIVHAHFAWYIYVCQTVLIYNNNPYLLIKVILFKIAPLGIRTVRPVTVSTFKHFVKSIIWNSASISHNFVSVREISLNLLLFKPYWVCKIKNKAALNLGSTECVEPPRNSCTDKGQDFGSSLTYFQMISQNYVNWPRSNSQHDSNFMDSDSAVLKDKFLHSIHIIIRIVHHWTS
jgi:hypothetical protein